MKGKDVNKKTQYLSRKIAKPRIEGEKISSKVRNATVVVVTSGKGGVGKTTTSAAISLGLAQKGFKTVVIDFDVGLRNLDLIMGCERRVVYDLISLLNKESNIRQTLIKDKRSGNLFILPASQTRDKDALKEEVLEEVMNNLRLQFDYIICDSPAGIEKGALMAMYHADKAIVVTNPEISSVRDSDRILGVLSSKTKKSKESNEGIESKILVTRYSPERVALGEMLSLEDIKEVLSIPILGMIPESKDVLQASNSGTPITAYDKTEAGQAYLDAIGRFLGQDIPIRFATPPRKNFLKRLFRGR
jgi:septum site-determining protein MinD